MCSYSVIQLAGGQRLGICVRSRVITDLKCMISTTTVHVMLMTFTTELES